MFTSTELTTICLFFGVEKNTQPGSELSECYFLESSEVVHPIGDSLCATKYGFTVYFQEQNEEPHYFQRDFAGLISALECLTSRVA